MGLRLFAHAWSGVGVQPIMKSVGDMNKEMIKMTKEYENHGRCDYNLTLINYMEPTSHTKIGFKEEADYGKFGIRKKMRTNIQPIIFQRSTAICRLILFFF